MFAGMDIETMYYSTDIEEDIDYIIKIEMVDGTSQLVQLTKEQAIALGIDLTDSNSDNVQNDVTIENVQNDVIDVDNITVGMQNGVNNTINTNYSIIEEPVVETRYNYKIIQPEDLNLRPNLPVPSLALPRGRPKKRPSEEPEPKQEPPPKITKPARTRYGRITRPPVHMEKDFEKIVIEELPTVPHKVVTTTEFKPLKTNDALSQKEPELPIVPSPPKKKKRSIPAQYRCSTCQKAYLGRNRMAQHLKKHPDHGIDSHISMENCEAWGYLVETALKAKEGMKGIKFCKEFINLVKNARVLAKYFFKPAKLGRADYHVDEFLSGLLNLKVGDYRFNENELCKDVSIFSFLEFFDDNFTNNMMKFDTEEKLKEDDHILSLGDELNCHKKIIKEPQKDHLKSSLELQFGCELMQKPDDYVAIMEKPKDAFNFFSENRFELGKCNDLLSVMDPKTTDFNNLFDCHPIYDPNKSESVKTSNNNRVPGPSEMDKNDFCNLFDCPSFYLGKDVKDEEISFPGMKVDIGAGDLLDCHNFNKGAESDKRANLMIMENHPQDKNSFSDIFTCHKNLDIYLNEDKKKPADGISEVKQGKEVDIFRNTIQNILNIGASDEHMVNVPPRADGHGLVKEGDLSKEVKESSHIMLEGGAIKFGIIETKDEIDLQKLHLLSANISDELILPDGGAVTGILDNSSDDIMNVDQFVNERFKKLTEADVDMPNLDLPHLDCFSFHSS